MANIMPRGNGYFIMVSGGYDSSGKQIRHTTSWKPDPGMTERQKQKALNTFVVDFENQVKQGRSTDATITFEEFSKRYMEQYANTQLAPKTIARYKELFKRINPAIGHLKMERIQVQHLADLYAQLGEAQNHKGISFLATKEFFEAVDKKHLTRDAIAKKSGISLNTVYQLFRNKPVARESAEKIALAAGIGFNRAFLSSRAGEGIIQQDHPASSHADFRGTEQSGGIGSDQGKQGEAYQAAQGRKEGCSVSGRK